MKVLLKLTLTALKKNRRRTIVTVIGIMLSAAMICGVAVIAASFQDLFIQSAVRSDGNFHAAFDGVSAQTRRYITAHSGVKEAMLSQELGYAPIDGTEEGKYYLLIRAYDGKAFEHLPVRLKSGRLPQNGDEIVLSEAAMGAMEDLALGQSITLTLGDRLMDGERVTRERYIEGETFEGREEKRYTIVGILERPRLEWITPSYGAATYLDESKLSPEDTITISILAARPRSILKTAPQMAESVGITEPRYNRELLRWMGISENIGFNHLLSTISLIIILLIMVGSITVIYNAFAISVHERKKQFGMLASIGATPRQIRRMVMQEGLVLGSLGILPGILAGIGGIAVTLRAVNRLMTGIMVEGGTALRVVVPPSVLLVTLFFTGMTILLSAYIPAKKASRISPIDAIRSRQEVVMNRKKLRTGRLSRALFGMEGELALKHMKRSQGRYRATVFSLGISIVLFISFTSFMHYGFRGNDLYAGNMPYDFVVEKSELTLEQQKAFYAEINSLSGIQEHSKVRSFPVIAPEMPLDSLSPYLRRHHLMELPQSTQGNYRIVFNITAVGADAFEAYAGNLRLNPSAYQDIRRPRGILVNQNRLIGAAFIEYAPLTLKSGEVLTLFDYDYMDGRETAVFEMEAGAVTKELPFGVSAVTQAYSVNLIVSDVVYEHLWEALHPNALLRADWASIYLKVQDRSGMEARIQEIGSRYSHTRMYVQNAAADQENMRRTSAMFAIFLYGFVSLITLIGITNIFNTISTNVALRRREFAMLKSIGLTPRGFNRMLRFESLFYGTKALLYGLPIGAAVSIAMFNAFSNLFTFRFYIPWQPMLYCAAAVFLIVFITMMYSSAKLKRENILEALREENL